MRILIGALVGVTLAGGSFAAMVVALLQLDAPKTIELPMPRPRQMTVVEKVGGDTMTAIRDWQQVAKMLPIQKGKSDKLNSAAVDDSEGEAGLDQADADEAAERKGRVAQQ